MESHTQKAALISLWDYKLNVVGKPDVKAQNKLNSVLIVDIAGKTFIFSVKIYPIMYLILDLAVTVV